MMNSDRLLAKIKRQESDFSATDTDTERSQSEFSQSELDDGEDSEESRIEAQ